MSIATVVFCLGFVVSLVGVWLAYRFEQTDAEGRTNAWGNVAITSIVGMIFFAGGALHALLGAVFKVGV